MVDEVDFAYSFFEPRELESPERVASVISVGSDAASAPLDGVRASSLLAARGSESVVDEFCDAQFKRCLLALFFVGVSGGFLFAGNNAEVTIVFLFAAVATLFWVGWRSFTHE